MLSVAFYQSISFQWSVKRIFVIIQYDIEHLQDFYNFLLDLGNDPISLTAVQQSEKLTMKAYSTYLSSKASSSADISSLMNGVIREKLKIIPKTVRYGLFYNQFWVQMLWIHYISSSMGS